MCPMSGMNHLLVYNNYMKLFMNALAHTASAYFQYPKILSQVKKGQWFRYHASISIMIICYKFKCKAVFSCTNVRGLGDMVIFSSHHVCLNIIYQFCEGEITLVPWLWLECGWKQGFYIVSFLRSLHTGKKLTQREYANDLPAISIQTKHDANVCLQFTQLMKFGAFFVVPKKNKGHVEV